MGTSGFNGGCGAGPRGHGGVEGAALASHRPIPGSWGSDNWVWGSPSGDGTMREEGGPEQGEQQESSPCAASLPWIHRLTLDLLQLSLVNSSLLPGEWGFEGFGTSLVSSGRPTKPV